MNKIIISVADLKAAGTSLCLINGNRSITSKNVESKAKSLKKYGILTPLMFVKGEKAISDGCSLIDLNGNIINNADAKSYNAIIDGQNRLTAALEAGIPESEIYLFECYTETNCKELLAESNTVVEGWKGEDFIGGSLLFNPDNELAQFAKKLSDKKFKLSTISKLLTFDKSVKITSKVYASMMKGEKIEVEYDLKRAQDFLDAASKFSPTFVAKRYLIDSVIDLSLNVGYANVINALSKLSDTIIKRIEDSKGEAVVNSIKAALNLELGK